jgi:hypothetical protein
MRANGLIDETLDTARQLGMHGLLSRIKSELSDC